VTARVEQRENLRNFGAEYEACIHETRLFIPYIF
jgi:hypothetical protein